MITNELTKRIITSFFLIFLLVLMFSYFYILIVVLIVIVIIAWIEFYGLISKILLADNIRDKILRFSYKAFTLIYLVSIVSIIIFAKLESSDLQSIIIYSILISIMSDIGGLIVGKIFKGKKLTKISPKKTISGSVGSLLFSLILIPFFINYFSGYHFLIFIIITLFISLISQLGDLFISYLKRCANVKNTSDLLPGHGGVLDRIDGILFTIPMGLLVFNI